MKDLKVRGRFLTYEDGTPFFYLADTAWELLHRLTAEEAEHYFRERARQGFTAVQTVALAEFEGLTVPNAYGRLPLLFTDGQPDPEKPDTEGDYSYWAHVDKIFDLAEQYGLYLVLLPTWGDKFNMLWGKGPIVFTEQNAYTYGKWIGDRYKNRTNLIWMLGGDRPLEACHRRIIDAMAKGIKDAGDTHLMTFHPTGSHQSTEYVGDADYIDFHTAQTGHDTQQCYASDQIMLKMAAETDKPYLDSEPRYEDHPACFNDQIGYFWGMDEVLQNAYWDVLCGTCGLTYGNHSIWSCTKEPGSYFIYTWEDALTHPGAECIGNLKKLRLSRDYFSLHPVNDIITEQFAGMAHMVSAAGDGYVYCYSPMGLPFTARLDLFDAPYVRVSWFDPRTGAEKVFAILPPEGKNTFVPPTQGKGCDWVLILEPAGKK